MKTLGVLDWENRHLKKQQFSNKYFFTISEEEFEKVKEKAADVKAKQEGAKKGKTSEKKGFLQHFRKLKQSVKITLTRNNYNKYNYKNKVSKLSTDPVFISMENSVDSFQKSRLTLCDLVSRKYQALLKKSKEQAQIFLKATFSLNIHADTDENCLEIDLKRVRSELARLGVC
ncbi:hypothetical protein FAI40_08030 [Acetobacteraceae bacterium]|nr:hypothetical protein FAI40_08030 [Acetobacteraceae bacterium]